MRSRHSGPPPQKCLAVEDGTESPAFMLRTCTMPPWQSSQLSNQCQALQALGPLSLASRSSCCLTTAEKRPRHKPAEQSIPGHLRSWRFPDIPSAYRITWSSNIADCGCSELLCLVWDLGRHRSLRSCLGFRTWNRETCLEHGRPGAH